MKPIRAKPPIAISPPDRMVMSWRSVSSGVAGPAAPFGVGVGVTTPPPLKPVSRAEGFGVTTGSPLAEPRGGLGLGVLGAVLCGAAEGGGGLVVGGAAVGRWVGRRVRPGVGRGVGRGVGLGVGLGVGAGPTVMVGPVEGRVVSLPDRLEGDRPAALGQAGRARVPPVRRDARNE